MSHYSDFSYIQRCTLWAYISVFLFYRVWNCDRFRCLHPKKIFSGELRSVITVLYILMLMLQSSWDVVGTWIKYTEKYMVIPGTGEIIGTPYYYWTEQHKQVSEVLGYIECVNLAIQTSVLVLLQCFWNYLSNNLAKRSFMTSFEFKFYIIWAISGIVVFPVLQWCFRNNALIGETIPLLVYSVEALVISGLGVRTHYRFKEMLSKFASVDRGGTTIIERLTYFQDMNILLAFVVFVYGFSMGILCVDALTKETVIAKSKIGTDLLIANCNTCAALMWVIAIFIFHPRQNRLRSADESTTIEKSATKHSYKKSTNNANPQNVISTVVNDIESSNSNMDFSEEIELKEEAKYSSAENRKSNSKNRTSQSTELTTSGSIYNNSYERIISREHPAKDFSGDYETINSETGIVYSRDWLTKSPERR